MKYLHTMVRVSDLAKSLAFYCDALGLREVRRQDNESGRYTLVFLAAPGDEDAQVELTYNWDPEAYGIGRAFGHLAYAVDDIYAAIQAHKLTLVFVNTRMQAEFMFQALWSVNEETLPIALHHGSLDVGQRRKVEAAMAAGKLKAVVCTATLDLGIDWGDVDLVVNVGAPKGASRLMQRIGRSNHRMDEPSQALLVPSNRFELLECRAALDAVAEAAQDTPPPRTGALVRPA